MSRLYLDAYDAAVLRHWGEMLSRHHASLRRPYATGRALELPDDDEDERDRSRALPAHESPAEPQA